MSLLVIRAGAAASRLQIPLLASALYPVYPARQTAQELAQEGLQPGVWDLRQTLPWLYRQLWAFSGSRALRQECSQKSPTGALFRAHQGSQWGGDC